MKVYLAGPIFGCSDEECKNWREEAKKVLPDTRDPMDRDYRGKTDEFFKELVEQDKLDIDESDALLVNYDKPSVGTSMEILYAWEQGKKIVLVTKGETLISPWLRYHVTTFVNTFALAFDLLKEN